MGDTLKPNVRCDEDTRGLDGKKCQPTDAAYSGGYGNLYKDKDNQNGITVKGGLAQINIRKCETIADDVPEDNQGQKLVPTASMPTTWASPSSPDERERCGGHWIRTIQAIRASSLR